MCSLLHKSMSQCQNNETFQEKDWSKTCIKFYEYNGSKKKIPEKKDVGKSNNRKSLHTITPDHLISNRSNFQMRRAQKKPAIEECEMLELEEKLKKTEENVFRLQSLTYNENLSQFISKDARLGASDSSFFVDEILEKKKDNVFSDMPDFITKKYDQFLSKARYKSSVKKKKVLEDIECDSLSMLMDERRARRAAALRLSEGGGVLREYGAERCASECSIAPVPAPAAAAPAPAPAPAPAASLRSPTPSPSPPASSLSLNAHRSDEDLTTTTAAAGALAASLPDFSEAALDAAASTDSEESEITVRPTSRLSGVLRFVRAATHTADYSTLLPDEQKHQSGTPDAKKRPHFGLAYTNVLRGVMLQDKGAVRNLKTCAREIQMLQKKMKKIRSQDAFSKFQSQNPPLTLDSINNTNTSNAEGDNKLRRALLNNLYPMFNRSSDRGRVTSNIVDEKEKKNNANRNTPKITQSRNSLHKAKSDLLEIYGKAGVNISALRRMGERSRWKL